MLIHTALPKFGQGVLYLQSWQGSDNY